jgi:hypothetical protein
MASNEKLAVGALLNRLEGAPGYQSSFEGEIDEIRIYETGLSAESILNLYNTGSLSINHDMSYEIKVDMYPNPAHDFVTLTNIPNGSTLQVLDLTGKLVYNAATTNGQTTSINMANFVNGIYHIRIENNGMVANKKLVVNK